VRGSLSERCFLKLVAKFVLMLPALRLRKHPLTPTLSPDGGEGEVCVCVLLSHGAHQFFVTRTPNRRGSVRNTFVVRSVSSLFRNAPVMAVVSKTFFT
jgi:hypothetical protein